MSAHDPTEPDDPVANLLAALNADAAPPPDWQARVWAEIAQGAPARRPWWGWLLAVGGAAVTAALILFFATRPGPTPSELSLSMEAVDQAGAVRSVGLKRGDQLRLSATLGGAKHAELRVYRDDATVVLSCADAPPCVRAGDTLSATVSLPTVGRYQALVVASDAPLPGPAKSLEFDLGALRNAGARVETAASVEVY